MAILNFIAGNWDSVLIILCAIGLVVGLIAKGQYAILNKIILALVTEAEKEFGGGTGKMKLAAVVGWVYDKIPSLIRRFISLEKLESLIDKVLKDAKAMWETNPDIKAYISSGAAKAVAASESQEESV